MDLKTIEQAKERIAPHLAPTPLLTNPEINARFGNGHKIYFKCENFQPTRSFKVRGALNGLLQREKQRILTRSSGNFAQALAWAGKKLGFPITVVMPENAPQVKVRKTREHGAETLLAGTTHAEGYQKIDEIQALDPSAFYLHSFDDDTVIAGQGTLALETFEQYPGFSHWISPLGGGGLLGGCATALKAVNPSIETLAVEPEGAADYALSRKQGERTSLPSPKSIADGLRTPCVGKRNWPLLQSYVDDVLVVPDQAIKEAMRLLFETTGMVIEPSGAASFAPLLTPTPWKPKGDVVCVLCGGNVDLENFLKWVDYAR